MKIDPQKQLKGENPVFSFPDTLNNGSGNKSISNSPQYQPDNLQSTFPLPEGGRVTVEILYSDAAENSQIDLQLRQPNQETLIEFANHNIGFTWVSPDYLANTNFEIGIYWYWENEGTLYQGIEAGAEVSSLGFGEYFIGFEAAGDDWDYNELVVRVKIETYLPIVFIDPSNISTGETATVSVKKQFYDGRIEDFDAGQLFEFGMMEGCTAGVLISGTDTSNYFNGVSQPVTFLAADSLENDEETVKIGVGVVEQNPLAKMQTKTNTLTQSKDQNIKLRDKNDDTKIDETKINSIIIGSCFGGDFESDKRGDVDVSIKGEPFTIAWDQITHHINTVPEMPKLLTIWLTPKNYAGVYTIDWDLEVKWVSKEQSPDKTFSHKFHNRKISSEPDGTDLPIPENDNTIIGGDEITLTINEFFYYDNLNQLVKPITKKITGMKILGSNGDNNVQMVKDYINAHDFPQPIDMPLSEEITIQDQRKQMQIIVQKESSFFQFFDTRYEFMPHGLDDIGYPNMNPNPHDWGLCQLSIAEPSFGIIWNWKTNINEGIHYLWGTDKDEKFAQVKAKFEEIKKDYEKDYGVIPRDPNREEFLKMLIQRYKRGYYYIDYNHTDGSKGKRGEYVRTEKRKHYEYGEDFWSKFDN